MNATTPKPVAWTRYAGDTDSITVKLNGIATLSIGAIVTATISHSRTKVAQALTGTVVSTVDKTVNIVLTTWLATRAAGRYNLVLHIDDVTWPEEGLLYVDVLVNPVVTP